MRRTHLQDGHELVVGHRRDVRRGVAALRRAGRPWGHSIRRPKCGRELSWCSDAGKLLCGGTGRPKVAETALMLVVHDAAQCVAMSSPALENR